MFACHSLKEHGWPKEYPVEWLELYDVDFIDTGIGIENDDFGDIGIGIGIGIGKGHSGNDYSNWDYL